MKRFIILSIVILTFQYSFSDYGSSSSKADCCSRSSSSSETAGSDEYGTGNDEPESQFGTRSVFTALSGISVMFQIKNISPEILENRFKFQERATNTVYYYINAAAKAYKLPIYSVRMNEHNLNDINKLIQSNLMNDSRLIATYEKDNKQQAVMVYGQLLDSNAAVTGYIVNDPSVNATGDIIDAKTLTSQFWKTRIAAIYWFK